MNKLRMQLCSPAAAAVSTDARPTRHGIGPVCVRLAFAAVLAFTCSQHAGGVVHGADGGALNSALTASEAGYDDERLHAVIDAIGEMQGVQGLLVLRRGFLVAERYWRGGASDLPYNLGSASNAVISTLVGIAIERGDFGLDDAVVELLPQLAAIDDTAKRSITVRHLLTMTSGLPLRRDETYDDWVAQADWVAAAFDGPLQSAPGARYEDNIVNAHLLSAVISATSGMDTRQFAQKHLFDAIGVQIRDWLTDPNDIPVGGNELWLLPSDAAKFGALMLANGQWGERQVIPTRWLATALAPLTRSSAAVWNGHGYLWQSTTGDDAFAAVGDDGQLILMSPGDDVVIVVTTTPTRKGDGWDKELFGHLRTDLRNSLVDPAIPHSAVAVAGINLRSSPARGANVIDVVPEGTAIAWFESRGDWLHIVSNRRRGWVHGDYVKTIEPPAPPQTVAVADHRIPETSITAEAVAPQAQTPAPSPARVTIERDKVDQLQAQVVALDAFASSPPPLPRYRVNNTVNFRQRPSLSGGVIGRLSPNTEFDALERADDWILAEVDGKRGWVHGDVAELVEPAPLKARQQRLATEIAALLSSVASLARNDEQTQQDTTPVDEDDANVTAEATLQRLQDERDAARRELEVLRELQQIGFGKSSDPAAGSVSSATADQRDEEVQQLQQALTDAGERQSTLAAEIQRLAAEKQRLQDSVDLVNQLERKRREKFAQDQQQLASLEEDVALAMQQLQFFEQRAEQFRTSKDDLAAKLDIAELRQRELQQALLAREQANATQARELAVMQQATRDLEARLAATSGRNAGLSDELQANIARDREQREQLQALRGENGRLSTELLALRQRLGEVETRAAAVQTEKPATDEHAARREAERGQPVEAIADLQARNAELQKQLATANEQLAERDRADIAQQREKDAQATQQAAAEIAALKSQLEKSVAARQSLQGQLEDARSEFAATLAKEQQQNAALRERFSTLQASVDELTQERDDAQRERDDGNSRMMAIDNRLTDSSEQLTLMRARLAETEASRDAAQSLSFALWTLQGQLLDRSDALESRRVQAEEHAAAAENRITALSEALTLREKELDEQRQTVADYATNETAKSQQLGELQQQFTDTEQRLAALVTDADALAAKTAATEQSLREARQENTRLQSALDEREAADQVRMTSLSDLQQTLQQRELTITALRTDLAEAHRLLETQIEQRETSENTRTEQLAAIEELRRTLAAAETRQQGAEQREQDLLTQLDTIRAQLKAALEQRDASDQTVVEHRAAIEELRATLTSAEAEQRDTQQREQDLQAQLEAAQTQLNTQTERHATTAQTIAEHRASLEELRVALASAQAQQRADDERQQDLLSQLVEAKSAYATLRATAEDRDALVSALRDGAAQAKRAAAASVARLEQTLDAHAQQQQTTAKRARELQAANQDLTAQLARARDDEVELRAALEARSAKIAELESALSRQRQQGDALAQRLSDQDERKTASTDELRAANALIASLQKQLDERTAALSSLEKKSRTALADRRSELIEARERLAKVQDAHAAQKTRYADQDAHVRSLESALQDERTSNESLQKRLRALEDELTAQNVELTAYRTVDKHLKSTLAQVSELQRAADVREENTQALIADVDRLQSAEERRQRQIRELTERNRILSEALAAARSRLERLQSERVTPGDPTSGIGREGDSASRGAPTVAASRATAAAQTREARLAPEVASGVPGSDTHASGVANHTAQAPVPAQIASVLRSWALAWSNKDVPGYLAHYSSAFVPDDGSGRRQWAEQRRDRIGKPEIIEVRVSDVSVQPADDGAVTATFQQSYRANHYHDRVVKHLDMRLEDGDWKIVRETTD